MGNNFRARNSEQRFWRSPSIDQFVGRASGIFRARVGVREPGAWSLDLSVIVNSYKEERDYPPYHPENDDGAAVVRVL